MIFKIVWCVSPISDLKEEVVTPLDFSQVNIIFTWGLRLEFEARINAGPSNLLL